MKQLFFHQSQCLDPYQNIATECLFVDRFLGGNLLYLWSNADTVVIGKHQNAGRECAYPLLLREGGHLARRLSGGGAVYHDINNLNFTFICDKEQYDRQKNFSVIISALKKFGLNVLLSGRNDILVDGRKFSGNAFYTQKNVTLHHGTILIDTDVDKMRRYLTVSKEKLLSHGVSSVESRVVNLAQKNSAINKRSLSSAIKCAYEEIFGAPTSDVSALDEMYLNRRAKELSSEEWLFGFDNYENRKQGIFDWGSAEVAYTVKGGVITAIDVYSDTLDVEGVDNAKQLLTGAHLSKLPDGKSRVFDDLAKLLTDF